jgi:hypothetical protein
VRFSIAPPSDTRNRTSFDFRGGLQQKYQPATTSTKSSSDAPPAPIRISEVLLRTLPSDEGEASAVLAANDGGGERGGGDGGVVGGGGSGGGGGGGGARSSVPTNTPSAASPTWLATEAASASGSDVRALSTPDVSVVATVSTAADA